MFLCAWRSFPFRSDHTRSVLSCPPEHTKHIWAYFERHMCTYRYCWDEKYAQTVIFKETNACVCVGVLCVCTNTQIQSFYRCVCEFFGTECICVYAYQKIETVQKYQRSLSNSNDRWRAPRIRWPLCPRGDPTLQAVQKKNKVRLTKHHLIRGAIATPFVSLIMRKWLPTLPLLSGGLFFCR